MKWYMYQAFSGPVFTPVVIGVDTYSAGWFSQTCFVEVPRARWDVLAY